MVDFLLFFVAVVHYFVYVIVRLKKTLNISKKIITLLIKKVPDTKVASYKMH